MIDEVNHGEESSECQSGESDGITTTEPQDDTGQPADAIDAESLLVQKDEELARAGTRIMELEEALSGRDVDIVALEQSINGLEEKLAVTGDSLAKAVNGYREMIIRTNPDIVAELIGGDTIELLDESLTKARDLIGRVRQGLETEISLARVPAGAPERQPPDLSALSPREKIQYAIGGKG